MVTTKTSSLTTNQAKTLIRSLFDQLEQWFKQSQEPTVADFDKITQDFELFNNGILVSRNLTAHIKRISNLRKKYSSLKITGPFEEPLVCGDRIACHYSYHWKAHDGKESDFDIISIVTLEGDKIRRWEQVVTEKGQDWFLK